MSDTIQSTTSNTDSRSRGIYLLPSLFTLAALFAGFYAVIAAMQHRFGNAALAVFIAMLFDGLDGRVARLTNSQTAFGAELDSLSDLLSFSMAPAIIMYTWSLSHLGKPGWCAAFIYCACGALRLARFNTQAVADKRYFQGLSTTAAAGFIAGVVWAANHYNISGESLNYFMLVLAVGVAALKVSKIPYRSFKDLDLRDNVPFTVMFIIVGIIVLITMDPPDLLLLIFGGYALSGPILYVWQRFFKRQKNVVAP